MLALTALSLLAACGPSPAGSNTPAGTNSANNSGASGNTGGSASGSANVTATKQAYINFLNCAKNRATTADQKAAIDLQINVIAGVPEATWAQVSANMTAAGQAWIAAYGSSCNGI